MLPTIKVGSIGKITRQFDALDYGDIVAFNFDGIIDGIIDGSYEMHGPFIYRVVGLPGDSIAVEKGICIINGKKNKYRLVRKNVSDEDLDNVLKNLTVEYEEFLPNGKNICIYKLEVTDEYFKKSGYNKPANAGDYGFPSDDMAAIKIPENHYFLMGDFRGNAIDSRQIGTIPREQIFGKVVEIKPPKKK